MPVVRRVERKDIFRQKTFGERLGLNMKHIYFSKKTIVLLSVSLAIILCGIFYFVMVDSAGSIKNEDSIAYADLTPFEKQKLEKEIELQENLRNFDKENIAEVSVYLETLSNEITDVNIFIVSHEEITNEDELMSFVSESLNLDIERIHIKYTDVETFTSSEKVR